MSKEAVYKTHTMPLTQAGRAALTEGDTVIVKGRYHATPAKVTKVTKANVTVLEVNASIPKVFNIRSGYERGSFRERWAYATLYPSTPGFICAALAAKAVSNVDNKTESLTRRVRKVRQLARDGYVSMEDAEAIESAFNQLYTLVSAHTPEDGAQY